MKILAPIYKNPESAYVIEDYPYGRRLRCKKRCWLETGPKGDKVRFCTQTTNPTAGHTWNKPRKSTYAFLAAVMYLDDDDHLQWTGFTEYSDHAESVAWLEQYRAGLTDHMVVNMGIWIEAKRRYEESKGQGE